MTTIVTRGYSDNHHARIQEFLPVWGRGPGPTARKLLGQRFFSHQLILQFNIGLSIVYLKGNYNFPGFQRGANIFQGWSNIFQGWSTIFQGGPTFSRGGGLNAILYRNPSIRLTSFCLRFRSPQLRPSCQNLPAIFSSSINTLILHSD